ncbi:MAG TPA: FAD/NAD(P)-binding protein [Stellaceae bacterium]|nr:FAD/NAD(P)-binding protein [Stellaceae bacterium]
MSLAATSDPMLPRPYRVGRIQHETKDIATFELLPVAGEAAGFAPGQFNMLYALGVGEVPISVSGDPADGRRLIHTVRAVGATSAAVAGVKRGAVLGVRGPFGTAWPVEAAVGSDVVIVAGGLGLAPVRPAIYRILADRGRYGRVALLYGTRSPLEILFRREIERWRRRLDIEIDVTVDHASGDWYGNVGVVPMLIPRAGFDPANTIAMVCGPEVMMRFSIDALRTAGVADDHIYLSMERNMKCAIGLCGHCQFGPTFVCRDGPVMRFDRIASYFLVREI